MDVVPDSKNIRLHFWVPPAGGVAKMSAAFEQLQKSDISHSFVLLVRLRRSQTVYSARLFGEDNCGIC